MTKLLKYVLCIFTVYNGVQYSFAEINIDKKNNPGIGLNSLEMIAYYGYPVQKFYTQSEDGFILNLIRIPYGKTSNKSSTKTINRPPVFLMHPLGGTSDAFMFLGEQSLPFYLADRGYDVWMGNARATSYSKKHITLSRLQYAYWDYSWHEIGVYDVTKFIDKVLEVTGEPSLFYIGHSQGGTTFYVTMSMRPEYNAKIRLGMVLAPAVFLGHSGSPLKNIAGFMQYVYKITRFLRIGKGPFTNEVFSIIAQIFCREQSWTHSMCKSIFYLAFKFDDREMNSSMVPLLVDKYPDGLSIKQVVHYTQLYQSAKFNLFDYGPKENLRVYGSESAPEYPLDKVTAPHAIFYALNDMQADVEDMRTLNSSLKSVVAFHQVAAPHFAHGDFITGKNANTLVYSELHSLMQKYGL